jgi:hypothetical protein
MASAERDSRKSDFIDQAPKYIEMYT